MRRLTRDGARVLDRVDVAQRRLLVNSQPERATTSSVSSRAARAKLAACAMLHGGISRAFARPGSGSLAITSSGMDSTT
ncbi:MAG: hypothetical protein ACRDMX_03260 [Solirubrobacteraceae bacterium]